MIFEILFLMGGTGQQSPGSMTPMLIMFGAIFAIMYFLMIRPQAKRQKQHEAMLNSVAKGDKIITAGGIHGLVQGEKDNGAVLIVKIAENVKVEINRSAIARKVENKGGSPENN
ncbi:preprotein translocase subunit YajC [candidate division KSB1 bacterium]|nr:preprotein translocase subunit YajC [candidate division KSB1 bacterium]